jgi:hypothetical protein
MKTKSPRHLALLYEAGKIDPVAFNRELLRHTDELEKRLDRRLRQLAGMNTDVTAMFRLMRLAQPSLQAPSEDRVADELAEADD